ncbi:MAG TPA: GDP-mannose 4,6-dehydratase [Vicinamibacteria bacterium]|nr:GDP-mannose 4,6-dehydratase [Vicinamibacteria bacterium]
MKLLVTGVGGFVGGHLVAWLQAHRPEVELWGVVRPETASPDSTELTLLTADLEDPAATEALFDRVQPDAIIHLAAQASVHRSWEDPEGTLRTNVLGLLHLLEAIRRRRLAPRVLVVGSAEEYGVSCSHASKVREDAPLQPTSPYAVSKVAQGYLALQYVLSHAIPIVRTRTFQATGPGRSEIFAESSFARQIAEIEAGRQDAVLRVGNLDSVRDFLDVRDVVRAYWLLVEKGEPGEVYNVCSGRGLAIREVLTRLLTHSRADIEIRVDESRLRPADVPAVVGDFTRLREATGWKPAIALDTSLRDLLDHWRARVAAAASSPTR